MSLAEGRMVGIGVVLKDLDGRFQRGARSRSSDAGSRSATIPSSIARLSSAESSLTSYLYAPDGRENGGWHGTQGDGVRVAMERKPCVFTSFRGQLELLNCISRICEGSELAALHRLGGEKRSMSSSRSKAPGFHRNRWPTQASSSID